MLRTNTQDFFLSNIHLSCLFYMCYASQKIFKYNWCNMYKIFLCGCGGRWWGGGGREGRGGDGPDLDALLGDDKAPLDPVRWQHLDVEPDGAERGVEELSLRRWWGLHESMSPVDVSVRSSVCRYSSGWVLKFSPDWLGWDGDDSANPGNFTNSI